MDAPGLRIIRAASRLVPFRRREEWRREWEAEAAYAWQLMVRDGHTSLWSRTRLCLRISTCWIDAFSEMTETMTMTGLLNDIRFAARGLIRYPGFTFVALLTLALGIGANTAVFTLVDGVLLKPLPFEEPEQLVALEHSGRGGEDALPMSEGLYVLYKEQAASLEGIALFVGSVTNVVSDGVPERVRAQVVTPGFFEVLRTEPALGRTFLPEEGLPDGERVVILSDGFWETAFGRDPRVLERSIDLSGVNRRIIGVMPRDFGHPNRDMQLWTPYVIDPTEAPLAAFRAGGIGRLTPGSSPQSLLTELEGLITRLPEIFPESGSVAFLGEVGLKARVRPLKEAVVGDVSTTLWILLGMVGFVLLIACANVANLLLVRAEGRQREMALRVAVGAGRMQILRSFLSESVALATVGGALGVGVAALAVRLSTRFIPTDLPRMAEVGIDVRVLGFTALVALGCAVFFGFVPMLRFGAGDLAGQLRDGGAHGATGGRQRNRLRSGLVIVQMALTLVLLVGSGLMFRSFQALRSADTGFDPEGVVTARVSVPSGEIEGWEETAEFYRQLQSRLADQAGILAAGFATGAPLDGGWSYTTIEVEDYPRARDEMPLFSSNGRASVGYFEAIGIPLIEGRTFRPEDGAEGTRSAIVSASFARRIWPEGSALGRRLGAFDGVGWYEIVGVVGDVYYESLEETPEEMVYYPMTVGSPDSPIPPRNMELVVKTVGDPLQFVSVIRREISAINPRIPLANPRTMDEIFRSATSRTSFTMALLGSASGIALLLGLVGIYGVVSYMVSQRTREIGVRIALGASAPSVRGMVVRQGLVLTTVGVGLGLVAAGLLSRVMASILFGVSATDPVTYGAVALSLVGVSLLASWLPARRAAAVSPATALRSE